MIKVLDEKANIKVNGKWMVLKAVLVRKTGGKTVLYIDAEGNEVFKQPLCRSQFKNVKLDEE